MNQRSNNAFHRWWKVGLATGLVAAAITGVSIVLGALYASLAETTGQELTRMNFERSLLILVVANWTLTDAVILGILLRKDVDTNWKILLSMTALFLMYPLRHRLGPWLELALWLMTWGIIWWIASLGRTTYRR